MDTLFHDKISIRALVIDDNKVWYAGNNSRFGFYNLDTNTKFENTIVKDNLKIEFRSAAATSKNVFILSVANPALLYRVSKDGAKTELVYHETNDKVFYDSMQFWNDKEGIAIGDPTENTLSIIITRDGGKSWQKTPSSQLPKVSDGEAAFASSNTNIVVKGSNTWVATGGIKSRVLYSSNKGKTWSVFETQIVQGKQMTGIFSADFYDEKIGFIGGGNYDIPNQNFANKAITFDGGKTWKLVGENQGPGQIECVQFVPNSNGKAIVTVGLTGVWYSSNSGESWKQLSKEKFYTFRFLNNETAIAAGKDKMIKLRFKK